MKWRRIGSSVGMDAGVLVALVATARQKGTASKIGLDAITEGDRCPDAVKANPLRESAGISVAVSREKGANLQRRCRNSISLWCPTKKASNPWRVR
jgi:hypothetical protein